MICCSREKDQIQKILNQKHYCYFRYPQNMQSQSVLPTCSENLIYSIDVRNCFWEIAVESDLGNLV